MREIVTVSELEAATDKYVDIAQSKDVLIVWNGKVVAKLTAVDQQTEHD